MRMKWIAIGITLVVFALAMFGMGFVQKQFFPTSDRPELIIDVTQRQNSTIQSTDAVMAKLDDWLAQNRKKRSSGPPMWDAPRRASFWRWTFLHLARIWARSSS
jgi:multidrug efflux pump subunit AcrB